MNEKQEPGRRIFALCAPEGTENPAVQALLRAATAESHCFGGVWTIASLRQHVVEHMRNRKYQDAAAALAYLCLLVEEGEKDWEDDADWEDARDEEG